MKNIVKGIIIVSVSIPVAVLTVYGTGSFIRKFKERRSSK